MAVFDHLLHLIGVLVCLLSSSSATHLASSDACVVLPGIEMMGIVYNPLTGLFGPRAVQHTYDLGLNISLGPSNPTVYAYPDQVDYQLYPLSTYFRTNNMSADFNSYFREHVTERSHHGWFSHSSTTTRTVAEHTFLHRKGYALVEENRVLYELSPDLLTFDKPWTPQLHERLQQLPPSYTTPSDKLQYRQFMLDYGPEIVTGVRMGGQLSSQVWFDQCFTEKYGGHWVSEQSGWSFVVVSHAEGYSSAEEHLCRHFAAYSETYVRLNGGDTLYFSPSQWAEWQKTIPRNPSALQFQTQPFDMVVQNATLAANLKLARLDYYKDGYNAIVNEMKQLPLPYGWKEPAWCTQPQKQCSTSAMSSSDRDALYGPPLKPSLPRFRRRPQHRRHTTQSSRVTPESVATASRSATGPFCGSHPLLQLPGLGRGHDMVDNLLRAPCVEFTPSTSPHGIILDKAGRPWALPAQAVVLQQSESTEDAFFRVYYNQSKHSSSYSSWDAWSVDFFVAGVTSVSVRGHLQVLQEDTTRAVAVAHKRVNEYAAQLQPLRDILAAQNTSRLSCALASLPPSCSSEQSKYAYRRILYDWGTSAVRYARTGLQAVFLVSFEESLVFEYSADWVMHQVSAWVQIESLRLGLQEGSGLNRSSLSTNFTDRATISHMWVGGNASLYLSNKTHYYEEGGSQAVTQTQSTNLTDALPLGSPQRACLQQAIDEWLTTNGSLVGSMSPSSSSAHGSPQSKYTERKCMPNTPRLKAANGPPMVKGAVDQAVGSSVDITKSITTPVARILPVNLSQCSTIVQDPFNTYAQTGPSPHYVCVPDGLYYTQLNRVVDDSSTQTMLSFKQLTTAYDKWLGISVGLQLGNTPVDLGASFRHLHQWYSQVTSAETRYLGLSVRDVSLYRLSAYVSGGVLPDVQRFVDALPGTAGCLQNTTCVALHCRALQLMGTHVVTAVTMGGSNNVTVSFSQDYEAHNSWQNTVNQVEISLTLERQAQGIAGFQWSRNVSHSMVNTSFGGKTQSFTRGGDRNLMQAQGGKKGNFSRWIETINTLPVSLERYRRLLPVYALIAPVDAEAIQRRENLRAVLLKYVQSGGVCSVP